MAETPPEPDVADADLGRGADPGMPRWVKLFAVSTIVLILLVVIVMVAGGGDHGPGRHTPSGDAAAGMPIAGVADEHTPEDGGGR